MVGRDAQRVWRPNGSRTAHRFDGSCSGRRHRRQRIMTELYRLRLQVRRVENGQYVAESTALPGLVAQGRTVAETVEIAQDVARKLIESLREHGDALPLDLETLNPDQLELDVP